MNKSQLSTFALNKIQFSFIGSSILPGLLLCALLAVAAFLMSQFGIPSMLSALLLGVICHPLMGMQQFAKGVNVASSFVLRTGVALLGIQITLHDVIDMGYEVILISACAIFLLISGGILLAKKFKLSDSFGALSGGAVAICGASAAMAISSVLPKSEAVEKQILMVVVGVTALSTLAMILYPLLCLFLGLSASESGIFLGASIHDVAQVIGAGYMISPEVGEQATIVKLFRVAMLCPVVAILAITFKFAGKGGGSAIKTFPYFLLGFIALVCVNSAGLVPTVITIKLTMLSKGLLLCAVAALGIKTSFRDLLNLGWRPIALIVIETLFLAGFILATLWLT